MKINRASQVSKRKRYTTVVELPPDVEKRLLELTEERGGHGQKKAIVSKVLTWVLQAPESVQQMVIGPVPSDMRQIYLEHTTRYIAHSLGLEEPSTPAMLNRGASEITE